MSNRRALIIFSLLVLVLYGSVWSFFKYQDQSLGGLDSFSAYSFPVDGSDSAEYFKLAENLLSLRTYTLSATAPYLSEYFRSPGYPFFIAYTAFGFPTMIIIWQFILIVVTAYLIFLMSKQFLPVKWAIVPPLLFLLDPTTIFQTTVVLSDSLFVFLIVLSVYLIFFKPRAEYWLLVAGLVLGYSVLVRPIGFLLIFGLLFFYILQNWNKISAKTFFVSAAIMLTAFFAVITPWLVRNYIKTGVWNLSSVSAYNLIQYNLPKYLSVSENIDYETAREQILKASGFSNEQELRDLKNTPALTSFSIGYLLNHNIFKYSEFHLIKTLPFFFTSSIESFMSHNLFSSLSYQQPNPGVNFTDLILKGNVKNLITQLSGQLVYSLEKLCWLVIFILVLGAWWLNKKQRLYIGLFWAIILYFAILTGPVSYSRYRLPVTPFLFIMAVLGLHKIMLILVKKRHKITNV